MRRALLLISACMMTVACARKQDSLRAAAWPILQQLDSALAAQIVSDPDSPDHGAIWCEACGECHSRAAEAMWPFACEYGISWNKERLRQALALGEWLIGRQNEDGSWYETPGTWTGTTTDQLLAMLLSYPLLQAHLDDEGRQRWTQSMSRAADYLTGMMGIGVAYVNYCATTAATLAEAYALLGQSRWLDKASELAATVISLMDEEGWLQGEGQAIDGIKQGIDIAYNLEMSLWGLARYAVLSGDSDALEAARRGAERHLWMIYPDGSMDASMGVRSGKWTMYGGSTSDGMHPLAALLGQEDGRYIEAAVRNISRMRECISGSGLLGAGPDHDSAMGTTPCVYHSFAKAKSLAMALAWSRGADPGTRTLPCDLDTAAYFSGINSALIRHGDWRGTISAYGYKAPKGAESKFMHRPSGGAMTMLWHQGYGLVQCSSQSEYRRWENSFPEFDDAMLLTPRIECGAYSNLYDFDAHLQMEGEYCCTVEGELKDRIQASCGIRYRISYEFCDSGTMRKTYSISGAGGRQVLIVEPVSTGECATVREQDGCSVALSRKDCGIRISLLSPEGSAICVGEQGKQVYPAVTATPLSVVCTDGEDVIITFSTK